MKKIIVLLITTMVMLMLMVMGKAESEAQYLVEENGEIHFVSQETKERYRIATDAKTEKMGIFDCESESWVILPSFRYVEKPNDDERRVDSVIPYICYGDDGSVSIFDGESFELIIRFDNPKVLGWDRVMSGYECPGIFRFYLGDTILYYSIPDGLLLFTIEQDNRIRTYIDGHYEYYTMGYPERLSMNIEETINEGIAASGYIIDLKGNIVSDRYNRITPLIWIEDKGIFLAELWGGVPLMTGPGYSYEEGYVFRGEYDFGNTWRCGLIDENGNELTDIVYDSIRIGIDGSIFLGIQDKNREIIINTKASS